MKNLNLMLVVSSFSFANSLISGDVLSAVRICFKNESFPTFKSKVSFSADESIVKDQKQQKNIRVGDQKLGAIGNQKHTRFLFGLN